jgi:hypothetical protein
MQNSPPAFADNFSSLAHNQSMAGVWSQGLKNPSGGEIK